MVVPVSCNKKAGRWWLLCGPGSVSSYPFSPVPLSGVYFSSLPAGLGAGIFFPLSFRSAQHEPSVLSTRSLPYSQHSRQDVCVIVTNAGCNRALETAQASEGSNGRKHVVARLSHLGFSSRSHGHGNLHKPATPMSGSHVILWNSHCLHVDYAVLT